MKKLMLAVAIAAALSACGRPNDDAATTASTSSAPSTTAPSTSSTDTTAAAPGSTTTTPSPDQSGSTVASSSGSMSDSSSASSTSALGAGGSGQTVYTSTCAMCHAAGVTGAPKPGDKDDWKPRIAQGKDTLYKHALQGFQGKKGMMPPKGGNASIADADVKAAVDYMVDQSK